MKYEDYQQFVVQASHCTVDERGYRLLRAAAGLAAEHHEFEHAQTTEEFNQEQGDVLFWLTVLDYWLTELKIEPIAPNNHSDPSFDCYVYILDRIEKYTRAIDKSKLTGVSYIVKEAIRQVEEHESGQFLDKVTTRNYDKLVSNPRERK
jgi:hypothetical protein